jgi:hypothetical protein
VVTLLAIGGFVVFRAVNRTEVEVRPEAVDYLGAVAALQESGQQPVYPPALPDGWVATSIDAPPGETLEWGLGMLTDDDGFAGVRQSGDSVEALVDSYVDADAIEGQAVTLDSSLAPTWRTFTDEGGDTAYAAQVGDATVLVFGSAPGSELQSLVTSLTTDPR